MRIPVVEGLFWFCFAAVTYVLTNEFDQTLRGYEFGATGWPRVVILMIAVGALGLLISGFRKSGAKRPTLGASLDNTGEDLHLVSKKIDYLGKAWRQALGPKRLLTFALPLAYAFAMHRFGFLFVSPIFLVTYMYLFGYRRWGMLLCINVVIYLIFLMIFVRLMYTPFPPGRGIFHVLTGQFVELIR